MISSSKNRLSTMKNVFDQRYPLVCGNFSRKCNIIKEKSSMNSNTWEELSGEEMSREEISGEEMPGEEIGRGREIF
jgi:hypothetical protein